MKPKEKLINLANWWERECSEIYRAVFKREFDLVRKIEERRDGIGVLTYSFAESEMPIFAALAQRNLQVDAYFYLGSDYCRLIQVRKKPMLNYQATSADIPDLLVFHAFFCKRVYPILSRFEATTISYSIRKGIHSPVYAVYEAHNSQSNISLKSEIIFKYSSKSLMINSVSLNDNPIITDAFPFSPHHPPPISKKLNLFISSSTISLL